MKKARESLRITSSKLCMLKENVRSRDEKGPTPTTELFFSSQDQNLASAPTILPACLPRLRATAGHLRMTVVMSADDNQMLQMTFLSLKAESC